MARDLHTATASSCGELLARLCLTPRCSCGELLARLCLTIRWGAVLPSPHDWKIRNGMYKGTQILTLSLCLTGCVQNPQFTRPDDLALDRYTTETLPLDHSAGPLVRVGDDIPHDWWELFHCEKLNHAIETALVKSPTLQAAQSVLRQAQEQVTAQIGALYVPQFDLKGYADRFQIRDVRTEHPCLGANLGQCPGKPLSPLAAAFPGIPTSALPNVFNLYNVSVNVAYQFDLFGGNMKKVESARAQVEYQAYELKAAQLTLVSNITTTALREAAVRAQMKATTHIIELQAERLAILEQQLPMGGVSEKTLLDQTSQLEQTRSRLPALQNDLESTRSQLAVYLGQLPVDELPQFSLEDFSTPKELPLSLPSLLVRQRPDILASESLLRQACAEVGVATANMFPQIKLSTGLGPYMIEANPLFALHAMLLSLGASLAQPIFHGGELVAQRRAAIAAYDHAAANYYNTILNGFKNVGDSLQALRGDSEALRCYESAAHESCSALTITQKQFEIGAVNRLNVLDTEQTYLELCNTLAQVKGTQLADVVALVQSLGGGWWNAPELATSTP